MLTLVEAQQLRINIHKGNNTTQYKQYKTVNTIFKFNVQGSVHRKCIPLYIQKDATLQSLFISRNCSTCFGWYFHPPSRPHTTVCTASGTCQTVMDILTLRFDKYQML